MPRLSTFVTLSPAPNFAEWLKRERATEASVVLSEEDRGALAALDRRRLVAGRGNRGGGAGAADAGGGLVLSCVHARRAACRVDSVARFHLGNGARLERLNFLADTSERALEQSHGLMVNYLYDLEHIEKNHEAYAQQRAVVAASSVSRLVKAPPATSCRRPRRSRSGSSAASLRTPLLDVTTSADSSPARSAHKPAPRRRG